VKIVTDKIDEVMQWLDTADNAEKEEFDSMQKDLEGVANPIMQKLYAAGGAPPAGGMPSTPGAGAGDGPTIEEVD